MKIEFTSGRGGLPRIVLQPADGGRAEIYMHGAHITSWRDSGGIEQLFLSQSAEFLPGTAIRGGIPVIFPQFAGEGPLPKHGFARNTFWQLTEARSGENGSAIAELRLRDSSETRAIWPHAFEAGLGVRVGAKRLEVEFSVTNTGDQPFSFTAALHSYLAADSADQAEVFGLRALHYRDSARGIPDVIEQADAVGFGEEVDRIYFDTPSEVELREPGRRCLSIQSRGFRDTVVWNPGPSRAAALKDLESGGWRRFVCVESATIGTPVTLAAGSRWSGVQILDAK